MARTTKQGLDYFPHNCHMDDQLEYIVALHKQTGYYVYFRLLEKIYSENGYYMPADKKNLVLFANRIGVDPELVEQIIRDCIEENLFDYTLFVESKILTSRGIQKRYLEAVARRKEVTLEKGLILINVDNLGINVNINYQNVYNNNQSKVKYSKVNKSKVNKGETSSPKPTQNLRELMEIRLQTFKREVELLTGFSVELRRNFLNYWTEPNKSGTKMRYELEKTWDTKRRLQTWARNEEKFNGNKKQNQPGSFPEIPSIAFENSIMDPGQLVECRRYWRSLGFSKVDGKWQKQVI